MSNTNGCESSNIALRRRAIIGLISIYLLASCTTSAVAGAKGGSSFGLQGVVMGALIGLIASGTPSTETKNAASPSIGIQGQAGQTKVDRKAIKYHFHRQFLKSEREPSGFGLYTYVLLPRRISEEFGVSTETLQKYKYLLGKVQQTKSSESPTRAEPSEVNLFLLFSTKVSEQTDINNYNYQTASLYIEELAHQMQLVGRNETAKQIEEGSGPFLLTVDTPLFDAANRRNYAYLDLSTVPPSTVEQLFEIYLSNLSMQRPGSIVFQGSEVFKADSLRWLKYGDLLGALVKDFASAKDVLPAK